MNHPQDHTLWLVEDDKEYANTLAFILNNTSGLSCVKHFTSIEELESFIKTPFYTKAPDLILLDIQLKNGKSGIEGLPGIKKEMSNIPVLMLTLYEDQNRILEALSAGAEGYIIKGTPHDQITSMIKEAINGQLLLSPKVKEHLLGHLHRDSKPAKTRLTEKQMAVLTLMCDGLGRAQIAEQLGITPCHSRQSLPQDLRKARCTLGSCSRRKSAERGHHSYVISNRKITKSCNVIASCQED